jgi:hypothetical protein
LLIIFFLFMHKWSIVSRMWKSEQVFLLWYLSVERLGVRSWCIDELCPSFVTFQIFKPLRTSSSQCTIVMSYSPNRLLWFLFVSYGSLVRSSLTMDLFTFLLYANSLSLSDCLSLTCYLSLSLSIYLSPLFLWEISFFIFKFPLYCVCFNIYDPIVLIFICHGKETKPQNLPKTT